MEKSPNTPLEVHPLQLPVNHSGKKKISVISTCPIPQWEHSPLEQPQKFTSMVRVLCLTAINYPFATTDLLLTGTETRAPHINPFSLCKQAGELDLLLKLTFTSIHSSWASHILTNRKSNPLILKPEFKITPALPEMLSVALPVTAHSSITTPIICYKGGTLQLPGGWELLNAAVSTRKEMLLWCLCENSLSFCPQGNSFLLW